MTTKITLTKEEIVLKYKELKSIRRLASYLHISQLRMEKYFRDNHLERNSKRKYTLNDMFFSNDTPESFYLAGFIAADGNIYDNIDSKNKQHNELSISLKAGDILHLEKIKTIIGSDHKLYKRLIKNSKRNVKYKDTVTYNLSIWAPQFINDLRRFNIGHRKSLTYDVPNWLMDHKLVSHFLRGYFDGDGSIVLDKLALHAKTRQARLHIRGTKDFLHNFHSILYTNCNLKTQHKKISKDSGTGSLQYTGNPNICKIMNYLYDNATIYLDRKRARYQEIIDNSK